MRPLFEIMHLYLSRLLMIWVHAWRSKENLSHVRTQIQFFLKIVPIFKFSTTLKSVSWDWFVISCVCIQMILNHKTKEHTQEIVTVRKWQPTPVSLPGKFHEWRSLANYSLWRRKELDMTEWLRSLTRPNKRRHDPENKLMVTKRERVWTGIN